MKNKEVFYVATADWDRFLFNDDYKHRSFYTRGDAQKGKIFKDSKIVRVTYELLDEEYDQRYTELLTDLNSNSTACSVSDQPIPTFESLRNAMEKCGFDTVDKVLIGEEDKPRLLSLLQNHMPFSKLDGYSVFGGIKVMVHSGLTLGQGAIVYGDGKFEFFELY